MKTRVKRSRKIDLRLIRPSSTYTLPELAKVTKRKLSTIWRYRREGMPTLEGANGKLVDGAQFIIWVKAKKQTRKHPCEIDEFFCFGGQCRVPRRPAVGSVVIFKSNHNLCSIIANCEACNMPMRKGWAMVNVEKIETALESYMGNVEDLARYRDDLFNNK